MDDQDDPRTLALRAVTALVLRTRISADAAAQNQMATDLLAIIEDLAFEAEMGNTWGEEKLETVIVIAPSLREIYARLESLGLDTELRRGLVALSAASLNQAAAVVTRSALLHVLELARSVPSVQPAGLATSGVQQQQPRPQQQPQPQPPQQPLSQQQQTQQQPQSQPQPQQQAAQKTALSVRIYCRSDESHRRLKKREAVVAKGLRAKGLAHQIGLVLAGHAKELFDRRLVVQEKAAQTSAGREQAPSFREPFVYHYLPESVTIRLSPRDAVQRLHEDIGLLKRDASVDIADDARKLASEYTIADVKVIKRDDGDGGGGRPQKDDDDEKRLLKRFHRYVLWLASPTRRTFRFVSKRTIARGLAKITEQLIGVEDLTRRMKKFFNLFSSLDYNIPHGVLLYGPPGTGKTTIVELLCEYLDVQLVAAPLASGDFNKPLMGESERMVEHVGERARIIPWQFCALAIDEIDGLAPTRDANASGGKVDLLSKILSMVGGNQNVSNLVLFGSTNRFDMMDEAFRRRIEFKFFVGKPSFEARRKWIVWKMLQHAIPLGSRAIVPVAEHLANGGASFRRPSEALRFEQYVPRECEQAIENLVSLTINFSNDAMRMLMRMLHEARGEEEGTHRPIDDAEALEFVRRICQAERIFLGSRFAPDILESVRKQLPSFDIPMMRKLSQMLDRAEQDSMTISRPVRPGGEDAEAVGSERMRCTHRMLVDFAGATRHQFNVQMTMDRHMSPEQHQIFARLHNPEVDTQWMIRRKDVEALNIIQSTGMRLTASEQRVFQGSHYEEAIVTIEGLVRQLESKVQLHNLDIANHSLVADTLVPVLADSKAAAIHGAIHDFIEHAVSAVTDRCAADGQLIPVESIQELLSTDRELVFSFYNKLRTTSLASGSDELIAELRQVYARETDSARDYVRKASAVLCERAENLFKTRHDVEHFGVARPDALSNEEVLFVLTHMAIRCRLECVYLIDGPTLSKHHCVEDTAALNFITGCLEEAQQYESGMFIVDLDSVANVTKSYSSLTEDSVRLHHSTARLRTTKNDDPAAAAQKQHDEAEGSQHTFSYNVQRPNVLCSVLEQVVALPTPNKLFWMVVLTKDPYLASRFKEKFTRDQWPLNADELRVESEAKEAQRERVCARCAKVYTERDNHPDSCRQHQRPLLCRLKVGPPPTAPGAQQAEELVELKSKEEYLERIASSQAEVMRLIDARWMCCGRGPFDDGESMCPHIEVDPDM